MYHKVIGAALFWCVSFLYSRVFGGADRPLDARSNHTPCSYPRSCLSNIFLSVRQKQKSLAFPGRFLLISAKGCWANRQRSARTTGGELGIFSKCTKLVLFYLYMGVCFTCTVGGLKYDDPFIPSDVLPRRGQTVIHGSSYDCVSSTVYVFDYCGPVSLNIPPYNTTCSRTGLAEGWCSLSV